MAPFRRMVDIAPEETGDRGGREEEDVFATVVAACEAGLAGVAGDVGFDGDAVAGLEVFDGGVYCEDLRELIIGFCGGCEGGVPRQQIRGQGCVCLRRS